MKAMWAVVCVAVALAVAGSAPAVESFDALLPEDTFLYVSVRDVPEFLGKIRETAGYKIVKELRLFERLTPPEELGKMRVFYQQCVAPLGEIFSGEVAFAITSMEGIKDAPRLVLLADVSGNEAALKKYLEETIYPVLKEQGREPEKVTCHGAAFTRIVPDPDLPDQAIIFGVVDGVLMASVRVETLEEVMTLQVDAAGKRLSANEVYADVLRALGDADVRAYFDLGAILGKAREGEDEEVAAGMEVSGLSQVRAIGYGMQVGPEGGTTTLRVSTDGPPSGWLGALVRGGGPLKGIKYVPEDAGALLEFKSEGLGALYKELAAGLKSVSEKTGGTEFDEFTKGVEQIEALLGMKLEEEVLAAFGGEIVLSAKVPGGLGIPPAAVLIEVKDKAAAEKFVARVLELIETSSDGAVKMTSTQHGGVAITTVLASQTITPAVAVLDDFLVVGTYPTVVQGVIDTAAGETNIGTKEDFRAAMQGLPTDGAMTMYVDLKGIYEFAFPLLAARAAAEGEQADLIKDLGAIGEQLSGGAFVVKGDESGFTYRAHSSKAVLGPGVLLSAGLVVPALSRAREAARTTASLNNVKQLTLAIHEYAVDHEDELPAKLSELAPEYISSPEVFVHPKNKKKAKLIDLEKPETIDEHTDYELVLSGKLSDIEDSGTAVMIREREQFSRKARVVGYADGHARVVMEEE